MPDGKHDQDDARERRVVQMAKCKNCRISIPQTPEYSREVEHERQIGASANRRDDVRYRLEQAKPWRSRS
jgi:hypothetical protein